MKKLLLFIVLIVFGISTTLLFKQCDNKERAQQEEQLKSDHIIFDEFGVWKVRHVFDQDSLVYKYSDAKTNIILEDGEEYPFQFNCPNSDHMQVSYIIPGLIDKVIITIDGVDFINTQGIVLHTFYGDVNEEFLNAFANTKDEIKIRFYSGDNVFTGTINPDGSNAALRWIRIIE